MRPRDVAPAAIGVPAMVSSLSHRHAVRSWGTVARVLVGSALIVLATAVWRADWIDLLIGLVALPAVATLVMSFRNRSAPPLRLGAAGHLITLAHVASVHRPIFARVFDRLIRLMEREAAEHRRDLLAGLSGRVLELGAGNGMNFQHYPATVQEVVALEPGPYLRRKAARRACRNDSTAAAGFAIERVRDVDLVPAWIIIEPHVLGIARAVPTPAPRLDAALSSSS